MGRFPWTGKPWAWRQGSLARDAAIDVPECLHRIPHNSPLLAAGDRVRAAFVEFFQTKGHTQVPCHAMGDVLFAMPCHE